MHFAFKQFAEETRRMLSTSRIPRFYHIQLSSRNPLYEFWLCAQHDVLISVSAFHFIPFIFSEELILLVSSEVATQVI